MPAEVDSSSFSGRSWKATFETDNKEEAERKCQEAGMNYEWIGECMKTTNKSPSFPIKVHINHHGKNTDHAK